ncbi:MAG: MFS transporter, partial [Candidatus Sericytochromatia bacterium]
MQKNLYKLQAYGFFHSLIFAYIIERLFGLERGLSIQDMVWVEISYAALTVLLEVPTGALADRWSRKKVMVLSAIFCFFEFYLLIFAYSLWGFLLSALAAALGNCLASGTDNALLYDSLKAQGQADKFEKYFGRIRFWGSLAGLAAALLGSQIAVRLNLTANYWFSLIGVGACILISLSLKEPPIRSRDESPESEVGDGGYWQHIFTALRFVRDHASLGTVVVYAAVLAAGFVYLDEYSQIYLKQVGIPITLFGIWSGLYMLLEIGCVASAWRL